ncbi:MAG TPA: YqeG family HAD IIIA-type phosphatase [Thermoguttaceae bacterium]|nr:YqeG family HAD IIIA-type phosphatase [Thermoguttaceae bacterium]
MMPRILTPDLRVHRVEEIDPVLLGRLRIESLLLDIDCTLKPYRDPHVPIGILDWIGTLRRAGVGLCLVSNGRDARVEPVARRLGLPFVATAMKPFPYGCRTAMARLGFDRQRTAMVGDQVFADVMAGRLAGVFTILVDPICPEQEPWYTRLKRPLERLYVRGVVHEPTCRVDSE